MRRPFLVAAVAGAAIFVAIFVAKPHTAERYRVAAIFDTAKGMVPGQQVKVAGAVVGRVDAVDVVPGPKARLTLSIERRFGPFRVDASCKLLPEGVISENFVACDPGSPGRPALGDADGLPTVPLSQTSVPTSLQDVMNVFAVPTADRIRILISELGIGTSGRGGDLNALLRRANPALAQSSRLLGTINRQRDSVDRAVVQTDRVLATLALRRRDVDRFVGRAADVASTTATHSRALSESVRRLPPLLDAARPALRSLDRAMANGTPLLRSLQDSAPLLDITTRKVPPFASATADALTRLSPVADTGRRTLRSATPLIGHLRTAAAAAVPFARDTDALLRDTRDRGGIEGMLRWLYGLAAASAAYDSTSHFATAQLRVYPQCIAEATVPGCTAKYNSPGQGTIPPDAPSCGPQGGAPWDPPTTCRSENPTRRSAPGAPARRPGRTVKAPKLPGRVPAPTAPPVRRPGSARPTLPKVLDLPGVPQIDKLAPLLDYLLAG